jgi:hypothetical protein
MLGRDRHDPRVVKHKQLHKLLEQWKRQASNQSTSHSEPIRIVEMGHDGIRDLNDERSVQHQ